MDVNKRLARVLNDGGLAQRLELIADDIRAYKPKERVAFLEEAARRLRRRKASSSQSAPTDGVPLQSGEAISVTRMSDIKLTGTGWPSND